jgi:hypothetical protein
MLLGAVNWNAIGAVGTMLAVAVALFYPPLQRWWNAPRLRLAFRHRDSEASEISVTGDRKRLKNRYRVLVSNVGGEGAQRVEVVLTDVYQFEEKTGTCGLMPAFIPISLMWTHLETPICEYLSSGAKLCEFGWFKRTEPRDKDESFTFATAVKTEPGYSLGIGLYGVRIVASASNCKPAALLLSLRIGGPIPFMMNSASRKLRRKIAAVDRLPSSRGWG